MTTAASPRSLADSLRAASDDDLAELLRSRPELLSPVPVDLSQLAMRAASAPSSARALDRLDRWMLQVLETVCSVPEPAGVADVAALLPEVPRAQVEAALGALRRLALVWGDDAGLTVVAGVRDVIGTYPAGLGPSLQVLLASMSPSRLQSLLLDLELPPTPDPGSAIDALVAHTRDTKAMDALLASAPAASREVLDRLTWGPPMGAVTRADREVRAANATSPVDWLLARGLLVASDQLTAVLPREVGLHLRGGRAHHRVQPTEPVPASGEPRTSKAVDGTAGSQAFAFVRAVDDLLAAWGVDGPPVLKAGGLGVRELRRAATLLDRTEDDAALVIEVAYVAGLVGIGSEADDGWLPTPAYDDWLRQDPADRWAALAGAWLGTTRVAALVGSRDDRDKVVSALGPDLDRVLGPEVRRQVLDVLAAAPRGASVSAEGVEEVLSWRRPRRPARLRHELVGWTLREAELLGITGAGALSGPGRALLELGLDDAADALAPLLPEPLDHVLLQADLTAIAPGPLVADLAHALALMADVESTGGATVYRFSEASVRRALDAGRSAADLHALLAKHSRTPVPQPLSYLVDDMARRHGRIRVGAASSYIRCDDEGLLAELVADRRSAELRLRRLAPTVVVAQASGDLVLDRLRAMGYAPAAEAGDGTVLLRRPDSRRTTVRQRPPRLVLEVPAPNEKLLLAAVRALRAGERASNRPRGAVVAGMASGGMGASGGLQRTAAAQTLEVLRSSLDSGQQLWIGYVDTHGSVTERVVDPVRLEGGYLTAYDHRYEQVHTFAVHRITGVAPLEPD
jgi:hypothetical protein